MSAASRGALALAVITFVSSLPSIAIAEPMSFRGASRGGNCNECEWLVAEGEITPQTPDRFRAFIKEGGAGGLLMLNSSGGNLLAGLQLGQIIRDNNLQTQVASSKPYMPGGWEEAPDEGKCSSACAYAFLGGVTRTAKAGTVGIHQFHLASVISNPNERVFNAIDLSRQQVLAAVLVDYVVRMGVDPRFVARSASVAPTSMHFLTEQEMQAFKVLWDASQFQPWKLEVMGNGIGATSIRNDEMTKMYVYCRADRIPLVWLAFKEENAKKANESKKNLEEMEGVTVFGKEVKKSDIALSVRANYVNLVAALRGVDFSRLRMANDEDAEIHVRDFHPKSQWGLVGETASRQGLIKAATVALRNCI